MIQKIPRTYDSWRLPRCQAEVNDFTKRWRHHAGKDFICERKALYVIDGRKLCKLHAGEHLLAAALKTAQDQPAMEGSTHAKENCTPACQLEERSAEVYTEPHVAGQGPQGQRSQTP